MFYVDFDLVIGLATQGNQWTYVTESFRHLNPTGCASCQVDFDYRQMDGVMCASSDRGFQSDPAHQSFSVWITFPGLKQRPWYGSTSTHIPHHPPLPHLPLPILCQWPQRKDRDGYRTFDGKERFIESGACSLGSSSNPTALKIQCVVTVHSHEPDGVRGSEALDWFS